MATRREFHNAPATYFCGSRKTFLEVRVAYFRGPERVSGGSSKRFWMTFVKVSGPPAAKSRSGSPGLVTSNLGCISDRLSGLACTRFPSSHRFASPERELIYRRQHDSPRLYSRRRSSNFPQETSEKRWGGRGRGLEVYVLRN